MSAYTAWSAIATWIGLFIGGFGLIFIKRTLDANVAAVQAAEKTIEIAQENARRELRAYLVPKECILRYEDGEPVATVVVTNCGQTPAERVMVVGAIYILTKPATIIQAVHEDSLSKGRMGRDRNVELDAGKTTPMTTAEIDGLENGTHVLSVYGSIEYRDIFDRTWVQDYEFVTGGKYGPAMKQGRMAVSTKDFREHQKA